MKKVSWIFKGGWFLGGLAIIYQIIILISATILAQQLKEYKRENEDFSLKKSPRQQNFYTLI